MHAGGARCLNPKHSIISSLAPNPRAIIYAHRNAFLWPVDSLCSRDLSVAIWDTRTPMGCVVVVSWYWEYTETDLPAGLTEVAEYARARSYPLWFSADSNAHSPMWGSPDLNARGRPAAYVRAFRRFGPGHALGDRCGRGREVRSAFGEVDQAGVAQRTARRRVIGVAGKGAEPPCW